VRRTGHQSGAVRHRQTRQRDSLAKRLRPVINTGQEMKMQFNARALH
jgi:hypothetical protein